MKIKSVLLHNFRSIKEVKFDLKDFSMLVGENNAGKSNVITALRMFYEDNGAKFDEKRDFPKFDTDDKESWVELEFLTSANEQSKLAEQYKSKDNILKVRRYFKSEERVKSGQSNIYGYENGILSNNLFYGARNISQAKLGTVIYIPSVSMADEALKLSGPSPFREMVNFVFKKVVSRSEAFKSLNSSIDKFNNKFMTESSEDGISLNALKDKINKELNPWEVDFGMKVNQIQPQDIVKSLFSYYVKDKGLDKEVDLDLLGQGLQRYLIFILIKLSSEYSDKRTSEASNFSLDLTLLLFEEPEAFLHPPQQEQLNISLRKFAQKENQQVLISTHSPTFVSKNIEDLGSILSVRKQNNITNIFQIKDVQELFDNNNTLNKRFSDILNDPKTSDSLKQKIEKRGLGKARFDSEEKLEEEALKYFMWLDSERTSAFFAKHVIICEGATEKVAFRYLMNNQLSYYLDKHIYILDSMGKFNIHRYMNLFGKLGVTHSVLYDKDNDKEIQDIINDYLEHNKNSYTRKIYSFDKDFETFLGIDKKSQKIERRDLKPLNVLMKLKNNEIPEEKLQELRKIFVQLCKI